MRSGLKFVTVVAFGVSLASVACSQRKSTHEPVTTGDAKIAELKQVERELLVNDRIVLPPLVVDAHETNYGVESNGRDFKWVYLTVEARRGARARLERYVRVADEALRMTLGPKKLVMVSPDALVARRDSAQSFLDSLAREEALEANGNYVADPSLSTRTPYAHSVDI